MQITDTKTAVIAAVCSIVVMGCATGGSTTRDRTAALLSQAENGNAEAQYKAGINQSIGDQQERLVWLTKSADQGYTKAQTALAKFYLHGVSDNTGAVTFKDTDKALYWFKRAAQTGGAKESNKLARLNDLGEFIPRDYAEALHWYIKTTGYDDPEYRFAWYRVGRMYMKGQGTQRDPTKAVAWFKKGAKMGSGRAARRVADMYYTGEYVQQNYEKAYQLYSQLNTGGYYPRGSYRLGKMKYYGRGTRQSYCAAARFFRKAGSQGPNKFLVRGMMHLNGSNGFEMSCKKAAYWYNKAALAVIHKRQARENAR